MKDVIPFHLIPRPKGIDIKFVIPHRVEKKSKVIMKRPRKGQRCQGSNKRSSATKTSFRTGGNEKHVTATSAPVQIFSGKTHSTTLVCINTSVIFFPVACSLCTFFCQSLETSHTVR